MTGEVIMGHFEKRAQRVLTQAARYDLMLDMAKAVDGLMSEVSALRTNMNLLLDHFGVKHD